MTKKMWSEIEAVSENGDPLKDVCQEEDLLSYCIELRLEIRKHLPAINRMAAQIIDPPNNVFAKMRDGLLKVLHE